MNLASSLSMYVVTEEDKKEEILKKLKLNESTYDIDIELKVKAFRLKLFFVKIKDFKNVEAIFNNYEMLYLPKKEDVKTFISDTKLKTKINSSYDYLIWNQSGFGVLVDRDFAYNKNLKDKYIFDCDLKSDGAENIMFMFKNEALRHITNLSRTLKSQISNEEREKKYKDYMSLREKYNLR